MRALNNYCKFLNLKTELYVNMVRKRGLCTEPAASAWDSFGPSLTPIRPLGSTCSVKFSCFQYNEGKLENNEDSRSAMVEDSES